MPVDSTGKKTHLNLSKWGLPDFYGGKRQSKIEGSAARAHSNLIIKLKLHNVVCFIF